MFDHARPRLVRRHGHADRVDMCSGHDDDLGDAAAKERAHHP
jgi:hypothetical protein